MKPLHLIFLIVLASCSSKIEGEGQVQKKDYMLKNEINTVLLSGDFEATLIQSDKNKVIIEAQQNLIDNLSVKEDGEELSIAENESTKTKEMYKVYIYNQNVEDLALSNNVSFTIAGSYRKPNLSIEMGDNSEFNSEMFIENLELDAEDNSKITFIGNTSDFEARLKDNSKMICPEFVVNNAELNLSDNSEAYIQVMSSLSGKSRDNAVLEYRGNPDKDFQTKDQSRLIKTKK